MAGEYSVLTGLLLYLLVAAAPTLLFWAALRALPAVSAAGDRRRRARRPQPTRPPLERLVADVRRLRREMCRPARTHVRRVAVVQAYDDALAELCSALDVPAPALGASDRAFARLQAEAAVEAAGVALDPPSSHGRDAA